MRFLTDQDVFGATVRFLVALGHDVVPVASIGLAQATDDDLLRVAQQDRRIFVTRDRDFGGLVFVGGAAGGVIYLRIQPSSVASVHAELERLLTIYQEDELLRSFLVVEPGRHRIRALGP